MSTAASVLTRSKADLPPPKSKKAPKMFTGHHAEIESFIREFVQMMNLYNIPATERFELITRYVSRRVAEVIEALTEYQRKDWDGLKKQLKKLYNHIKVEKRYSEKNLDTFVKEWSRKPLHDLSYFRKYQRDFLHIGGWLLQAQKITDNQYRKAFWMGLPRHIRKHLEARLFQVDPNLSLTTPFPVTMIIEAAEHIFDPSRFDEDPDSDDEESSQESSDDSVTEDESSDDERRPTRKEKRKKKVSFEKETSSKNKKIKDKAPSKIIPPSALPCDKTDEVAELIDRLGKLSINDSAYMPLYFQITSHAPNMIPFLVAPPTKSQGDRNIITSTAGTGTNPKPSTSSFNGTLDCYFCGEKGHGMRRCLQAENMIAAGIIVRNDQGRIMWKDGTSIFRTGNETILAAVNRELAVRNQASKQTSLIRHSLPFEDVSSSDDDDMDYIVKDGQVYAAIRPKEDKKPKKKDHQPAKKKLIFDGVDIPKRPIKQEDPVPDPHIVMPPPMVFDTPDHPFDPLDDDMFMEDVSLELPEGKPKKKKLQKTRPDGAPLTVKPEHFDLRTREQIQKEADDKAKERTPPQKQQSQLQRSLNMDSLMDKVLGTPTTVTLRELLGASPTASKKIQDYLRVTRSAQNVQKDSVNFLDMSPLNPQINRPEYNPHDAKLVNLQVKFKNGQTANALIDPGSELDIMGNSTWMESGQPMDIRTNTLMRDASNHLTNLRGRCFDIELMAGNFITTSDFWIGDVPFQILCGQPWQRRNKVNIEERNNGTWLVHQKISGDKLWELCAIPAHRHADHVDHADHCDNHFFGQVTKVPKKIDKSKTTLEEVTDEDT